MNKTKNSLIIIALVVVITFVAYRANLPSEELKKVSSKVTIKRLDTVRQPVVVKTLPPESINPNLSFETQPGPETQAPEPVQTPVEQPPVQAQPQINSYSASVSYDVPGATQSMSLKVSLQNNIIVDISASLSKDGGTSRRYQQNFENSYKSQVIGKNIKNLRLSRVGGASLTTDAFNEAISSIKNSL